MKKGTKLTDTPKDCMLRVRVDEEFLTKLDKVCENENASRSVILRKGVEELYRQIKK